MRLGAFPFTLIPRQAPNKGRSRGSLSEVEGSKRGQRILRSINIFCRSVLASTHVTRAARGMARTVWGSTSTRRVSR
jgi:hypothetical protein